MKQALLLAIVLGFVFSLIEVSAAECPRNIYYKNGKYLKSGNYFYYPNGKYLRSGNYLYYQNGKYLKAGSNYLYYPNGKYLKSGSSYLYYPNGKYLKSGNYYYYDNGKYMKSGNYFYWKNGKYARSGGRLFREDGSETAFPVRLNESIGEYGFVSAFVTKDSHKIDFQIDSLPLGDNVQFNGFQFDEDGYVLHLKLSTGYPGEIIHLSVKSDGSTSCGLQGGAPPEFVINARAATLKVSVKEGYHPKDVKQALEEALDELVDG